jgi:hypothetical protein
MTLEQARAELTQATTAQDAAAEALRRAKVTFFDTASDKDRKAVVAAEDALSASALLLERAEHRFGAAQREAAEANAADQRRRLMELQMAEVARSERAAAILALLVDAERTAFGLISELEKLTTDAGRDFSARKSLALALGEPLPMRPSRNFADYRYELQALIKSTQIAEHRDGHSNGQVAAWLQPAAFAVTGVRRGA